VPTTHVDGGPVVIPEPDEDWHKVARAWYDALAVSGQSVFYAQSDWALAYYTASLMTESLHSGSAAMAAQVMKAQDLLLVTEGSRRRVRIELVRQQAAEDRSTPSLAVMSSYRSVTGASQPAQRRQSGRKLPDVPLTRDTALEPA
jgi:hypothetical protein